MAKEYRNALYSGCDGKSISDENLLNVIQVTYENQRLKGWTKYIHGHTLIMCHSISLHDEVPMYEYYINTGIIGYIYAD